MNKQDSQRIDVCKGIGAILVLLGHSFILGTLNLYETHLWCKALRDTIYSFHMPLFFVIAGYLYKTVTQNNYLHFFKRKSFRLFIPYFVSMITPPPRICL